MKTGFGGKLSRSNGIETNNKEQWNELFRTARAVKFNSLKKLNACNCKEREIENKRRKTNDRKKEKRRKKQQQQRYTISDSTSLSWFDLFSFFLLRWCCCFVSLFHFIMCVVCVCLNAKQNKYCVRKKIRFSSQNISLNIQATVKRRRLLKATQVITELCISIFIVSQALTGDLNGRSIFSCFTFRCRRIISNGFQFSPNTLTSLESYSILHK